MDFKHYYLCCVFLLFFLFGMGGSLHQIVNFSPIHLKFKLSAILLLSLASMSP